MLKLSSQKFVGTVAETGSPRIKIQKSACMLPKRVSFATTKPSLEIPINQPRKRDVKLSQKTGEKLGKIAPAPTKVQRQISTRSKQSNASKRSKSSKKSLKNAAKNIKRRLRKTKS